jgi:hypothetical protein
MKSELGINNYAHRMVIKAEIDCLYPELPRKTLKKEASIIDESMSDTFSRRKSEFVRTKSKLHSPIKS